jgi:hypothetical protein
VNRGIRLSASVFSAGAAQGTAIGTLSVAGGTGTYTFTLTDSHVNAVQVAGTNGVNLQVGSAASSAGSFNITVHADNGAGSTFDRAFTIVAWSAVSNTAVPAITGSPVQAATLSVSNGTWSGFPAPSYSYQWNRASVAITGAAASTYVVQAADVGSAITCTVTASNGFSSASATSAATASVTKTTLSYTPVTSASIGAAYTGATPTTTNGTAPYTYSLTGTLPAGLSLNSSTGVISGTPTTIQTASGLVLIVTDANGVAASSSSFSIAVTSTVRNAQVLIGIYGQSNASDMYDTGALFSVNPPAANAGTSWFDGAQWTSVPSGNGVRELLNAVNSTTGKTVGSLGGAIPSQTVAQLSKGTQNYTNFITKVIASGGILDFIVWYQGEGDSAANTPEATYKAALSQLHSDIVADLGTTKAACPLVLCGLATTTDPTGEGTDASWDQMERTLIDCGSGASQLPHVYYSHSNRDGVLAATQNVHIDAASQGRNGARFAKTICELIAGTTNFPNWHIASAATVDATTTTVTLANDGLGTDFTPTSGITGFELSGDNGSTWAAPTAAVRTDATTITLTHSALDTGSGRKLRYLYGRNPDTSALVKDNSAYALPLDNSAGVISPTPLAASPVFTFASSNSSSTSGTTQTFTGVAVPGSSQALLAVIGITMAGGGPVLFSGLTVTAQPSNTPITATLVDKWDASSNSANAPIAAIYQAQLPAGTTTVDLSVNLAASPFGSVRFHVSTVPVANLNSTTAVGHNKVHATTTTSASLTLATSAGGCVFAIADNKDTTAVTVNWATGSTETYAQRSTGVFTGGNHDCADAANTGANAASVVEVTYPNAANMTIVAASYR